MDQQAFPWLSLLDFGELANKCLWDCWAALTLLKPHNGSRQQYHMGCHGHVNMKYVYIYIYVQEVLMILYTILHNVYYIIYIVSDIHMILLQSQVLWGSLSQSDPTLLNANTWHQRQHHQERKVWSLGKATATINGGTVPNSWMVNEKSQTNSWMIFGYPHGLETSTLKV